jgi:hypothetical protein
MSNPPEKVWIYHIVHKDRLQSIMDDGFLWSDAETRARASEGTTVGMLGIKNRRLVTSLSSHPDLAVGACVPFYFCPRSIMLFLLHKGNHPEVTYKGGQEPIVHLVAEVPSAVNWAESNDLRWAFTLSNAGSGYFEDRSDLSGLGEIDWEAVKAVQWSGNGVSRQVKEGKQAEFLIERCFPWGLVQGVGVRNEAVGREVTRMMTGREHRPTVKALPTWYY